MSTHDPNTLQAADLRTRDIYFLMTSLIVPRPIAWVGTRSVEGVANLAPFSYFMGVSSKPPALAISVARGRGGVLKDTARNILANEVFTVSIVDRFLADRMNITSASYGAEVNEFEAAELTEVEGERVAAPRPAEARVGMECRLVHAHDMGSTHLLVGEILCWHLDPAVTIEGAHGGPVVDIRALEAIGRLGGQDYVSITETFGLPRPVLSTDAG